MGAATGVAAPADLLRVHRPAMGSFFEVRLGAQVPGAVDLASRALDLIDELEAQLTVYRDDSEVSRLNATAHLGPVAVEPGLFGLLERAVELSRADRRGLRRDGGGPLGGLGVRPRAEAGPRRRDAGRRPGPDRLASPPARPASGGRSPSTARGS